MIPKAHKVLAGGSTFTNDVSTTDKKEAEREMVAIRAMKKDAEPVFWHATPVKFWEEMVHDYSIKAMVDLTPGDGAKALACLRARIPYVGVVFGDAHRAQLFKHLDISVMKFLQTEGDKLYQPGLAQIIKAAPHKDVEVAPPPLKKPRKGAAKAETANGPSISSGSSPTDEKNALLKRIAELSKGGNAGGAGITGNGEDDEGEDEDEDAE